METNIAEYMKERKELMTIINQVNVDCKDDGRNFTVTDRIQSIESLLENTDYHLLHKGNLCFIYGKKPVKNQSVILISSHIDCVYDRLFCREYEDLHLLNGTFDNSLTNACLLYDMIHGRLNDNVVIAFTGDEEEDAGGVKEVVRQFRKWNTSIALTIVLDVTEEGWKEKRMFTVENDLNVDIKTGSRVIELLEKYRDVYGFIHNSEPDESYDYDEEDIPCFSLCIPSYGDMHGKDGVSVRTDSLFTYCDVLAELANSLSENPEVMDRVYYVDYEDMGNEIKLCGLYSNEDDCQRDDYVSIKEHHGQLELPSLIHGKRVVEIQDYCMMGHGEIKTLIVPRSFKSLGKKNFSQCDGLEEVVLNCHSSAMCEWNFAYCNNLRIVKCRELSMYYLCKMLPHDRNSVAYGCFDGRLGNIEFIYLRFT